MALKSVFEVFRVPVVFEYFVGSWKRPKSCPHPKPLEKFQSGRPCLLFNIHFNRHETMKVTKVKKRFVDNWTAVFISNFNLLF